MLKVNVSASPAKIAWVPFPWCTSRSTTAARRIAPPLEGAHRDRDVVEDAEPLAVVGESVVRAAGEIHRDAVPSAAAAAPACRRPRDTIAPPAPGTTGSRAPELGVGQLPTRQAIDVVAACGRARAPRSWRARARGGQRPRRAPPRAPRRGAARTSRSESDGPREAGRCRRAELHAWSGTAAVREVRRSSASRAACRPRRPSSRR